MFASSPAWLSSSRGHKALFLVAVFLVITLSGRSPARTRSQSPYAAVEQLARVLVLVENHYVEPVDRRSVLEGAIKGMVAELDPHSAYLPPEDYSVFQSETEGAFVGVGVEVDARHDSITVIAPIEGSPAERAGIRSGDRIVAVDGSPTRGQPLDRIVRKIRGKAGSKVRLTIQRPDVAHPIELVVTRAKVHVTSVVGKRLLGHVAYLRVKQFQKGTHTEFLEVLGKVREQNPAPLSGVVLDLRTNPGGLVDEAVAVVDELLGHGSIYSTRARGKVVEEVRARGGGSLSKPPTVVLVNEYSASAAELIAGAIQDQGRGVIVGTPTFGKGSVQSIVDLPGGAGLKLTTMLYYTPNGRSIQAEGIQPDVHVAPTKQGGSGIPLTRERDIEGHIPSESAQKRPPRRDGGAPQRTLDDVILTREVPTDPRKGKDLVLSIGYQIVRGVLSAPKDTKPSPRK